MTISTGVSPLDERVGGLPGPGLYILSAPPVGAREAMVLHFLEAGLEDGTAALVSRSPPDRVFGSAEEYGMDLRSPWEEGRLMVMGFRGEHEARIRRAGAPREVFRELRRLLEEPPGRLALDPGTPLWSGRSDGSSAAALMEFVEDLGIPVLATTTSELDGPLDSASELITHGARGLFRLRETSRGLVRLRVQRLESSTPSSPEVTLTLEPGTGLVAPDSLPERREGERTESRRVLFLPFGGTLPEELSGWLRDRYEVRDVDESMDLVTELQKEGDWALVLLHLRRAELEDALRASRVCRRLRPRVPVVAVARDPLRATDRAALLDAGADECISGPLNVAELRARLRLVAARDAAHPVASGTGRRGGSAEGGERPGSGTGGDAGEAAETGEGGESGPSQPIPPEEFRVLLRRQMQEDAPPFSLVRFRGMDSRDLAERLASLVRSDAGDRVSATGDSCDVFLPGTLPDEAERFVQRIPGEVAETVRDGEIEILGGVRDRDRLTEILG